MVRAIFKYHTSCLPPVHSPCTENVLLTNQISNAQPHFEVQRAKKEKNL